MNYFPGYGEDNVRMYIEGWHKTVMQLYPSVASLHRKFIVRRGGMNRLCKQITHVVLGFGVAHYSKRRQNTQMRH